MKDGTLVESTDCTRPISWKMGYRNLILRDKTRVSGRGIRQGSSLGLYPIVTLQYSSIALYRLSYHIQYLFF